MNKEYYLNFKSFLSDLTKKEKNIREDLESYKNVIRNNSNSVGIENRINKNLESFKNLVEQLDEAYKFKNAPSNMSSDILENRQKEIYKFKELYDNFNKDFQKLKNDKYTFQNQNEEDYKNKEEYKDKKPQELIEMGNDIMNKQEDKMDDIIDLGNEGILHVQQLNKNIIDSNKNIKGINQNIEQADSKINKLNKRFENYLSQSSPTCLIIFLIVELAIGIVLIIAFAKIGNGFTWGN